MLYERLQNEIKGAMLSKDKDKRDVLKQVQMKTQAFAKENKVNITDEIVLSSVSKELKQLNQTKDFLVDNKESDLYKSTEYKIGILQGYLPEQLSKEDCLVEVSKILSSLDNNMNNGAKIGAVMKKLKGKADNKLIKECIDTILLQ